MAVHSTLRNLPEMLIAPLSNIFLTTTFCRFMTITGEYVNTYLVFLFKAFASDGQKLVWRMIRLKQRNFTNSVNPEQGNVIGAGCIQCNAPKSLIAAPKQLLYNTKKIALAFPKST